MRGIRVLLTIVAPLLAVGVAACGSTQTEATDSKSDSSVGDCAYLGDAYAQADDVWDTARDRAATEIADAEAAVRGRDDFEDFMNGEYLREWSLVGTSPTPSADLAWDKKMTELAASLWPKVEDEDLKSALREYAQGQFRKANWAAVVAICPPSEGSMAAIVKVSDRGVEGR